MSRTQPLKEELEFPKVFVDKCRHAKEEETPFSPEEFHRMMDRLREIYPK